MNGALLWLRQCTLAAFTSEPRLLSLLLGFRFICLPLSRLLPVVLVGVALLALGLARGPKC